MEINSPAIYAAFIARRPGLGSHNAPVRSPPELSRQSHDNLFAVGGALAVPSTSLWMRLPMRQ
jgi:hypothetical protein